MTDVTGILLFGYSYLIGTQYGFEAAFFFWSTFMAVICSVAMRRMRHLYKKD